MPSIILPTIWTSQPQTIVGIDWGNPITKGLVFALNPVAPVTSHANYLATAGGAYLTNIGKFGRGVVYNSAGLSFSEKAAFGLNNAEQVTLFSLILTGSNNRVIAFSRYSGQSRGVLFHTGQFGDLQLLIGPNSDFAPRTASWSGVPSSGYYSIAAAWDGGDTYRGYLNGASLGSPTLTGTATTIAGTTTVDVEVQSQTTISGGSGTAVYLTLAWNRALTSGEIASLNRNPWQIFSPIKRRIWVPSFGAGGGFSAAGNLVSSAATIDGAANRTRLHQTTGALLAQSADVNGTANRTRLHQTTGTLLAQPATLDGTADRVVPVGQHPSSGNLVAAVASITGTAKRTRLFTAIGDLIAGAALITGTAAHATPVVTHPSTGTLAAQSATVTGTAERRSKITHATNGALIAGSATITGNATNGAVVPPVSTGGGGGGWVFDFYHDGKKTKQPKKKVEEPSETVRNTLNRVLGIDAPAVIAKLPEQILSKPTSHIDVPALKVAIKKIQEEATRIVVEETSKKADAEKLRQRKIKAAIMLLTAE